MSLRTAFSRLIEVQPVQRGGTDIPERGQASKPRSVLTANWQAHQRIAESLFNWMMATTVAVNGGGIVTVLRLGKPSASLVVALSFFVLGVVLALLAAVVNHRCHAELSWIYAVELEEAVVDHSRKSSAKDDPFLKTVTTPLTEAWRSEADRLFFAGEALIRSAIGAFCIGAFSTALMLYLRP